MAEKKTKEVFKYIYTNKAICVNMEWSPISGLKFACSPYVGNQEGKGKWSWNPQLKKKIDSAILSRK